MLSSYGIVLASSLGSFSFNGRFSCLLPVARYIDRGLMFGSLTSAIVGTLTYFSTAEQLQKFTFGPWESGNLSWTSIGILFLCVLVGLFLSLFSIKPLNALLLGENYA
jgi:iron complex transport system permease protein